MLYRELKEMELNRIIACKVYAAMPVRVKYKSTDYSLTFRR
ncbi:winged helix-turn-helix transcriptional regulator [Chitinophaga costaii]